MSHPPRAQHTRTARCRALAATSIKAFLATAALASALLIADHLLSTHSTVAASATTAENGTDHAEAPDTTAVRLTSVSSPLPRNDGKTTNGVMTVSPSAATYGTGVRSGRARTMIPVVGSSDATLGDRLARSDFPIRDSMSVGARRLTEQSEANETRCSRQPGPVDYRDPNQAGLSGPNVGGRSSWLVQVGPIGVDLNASDLNAGDTKSRCARHLKSLGQSAKESDCGCGTPSPGGWGYNPGAPPTPPRTQPGPPSAYYPPGYSPTTYYPNPYPNSAVPNAGPPNTPDQYTAVPNAHPNATYPNGYYPASTDPFGYGPPGNTYRRTGTNPCAPSPDYGPASYPMIDSSGRLICPATPINGSTPPGAGVQFDGW